MTPGVRPKDWAGPLVEPQWPTVETWHPVLVHLFDRYHELSVEHERQLIAIVGPETARRTVVLCAYARHHVLWVPETKAQRWLGFVQGVLTAARIVRLEDERAYQRPLFHRAGTA